ncbi:MAG TPA: hypothetical protein VGE41_03375, partial [Verrucomicrobiae bacterium]
MLFFVSSVYAGKIRTLDGAIYDGEMAITSSNCVTIALSDSSRQQVLLTNLLYASFASAPLDPSDFGSMPNGWHSLSIGDLSTAGLAGHSNGTFAVRVAAQDIGDRSDTFQYVCHPIRGDVELSARIQNLAGADRLAKVGIMLRERHDANV